MKCPKCGDKDLRAVTLKAKNLKLDQCQGCKGLWFDAGELGTLLGIRGAGKVAIPGFALAMSDQPCPTCNVPLQEFCYPGTMTLVDMCGQCNGTWLDDREWKEINKARSVTADEPCPKCGHHQPPADACSACGVVFAKYPAGSAVTSAAAPVAVSAASSAAERTATKAPAHRAVDEAPGFKGTMLRFVDGAIARLTDYSEIKEIRARQRERRRRNRHGF